MKKNKPSATAMFVANGMYYNIHQEMLQQDIPEDVKKYNAQLIEHFYGIKSKGSKRWRLFICNIVQLFSIRGFFLHFLIRKKCIEKQVKESIAQGYGQVVILGAGYDTLCSRLAEQHPNVNFIELDHPATAANKVALFKDLEWQKSNIKYLAHDLKNIDAAFKSNEINTSLKTVFVCEGVFMYLQQEEVKQILNAVNQYFKSDCKFVFTFMEESASGNYMFKNATAFVKLLLKLKNEPFTWGMKPENIGKFLESNSWYLMDIFDHQKLKRDFLSKENQHLPVAIGENVVCAINHKNGK